MFEDEHPSTCLSCGFLGKLLRQRGMQEVDANDRLLGTIARDQIVWCFRRADAPKPLHNEINRAEERLVTEGFASMDAADTARRSAVREVLASPRPQCDGVTWYAYQEGFDPRWHYEDWRMVELDRLRQQQLSTLAAIASDQKDIAASHLAIASSHAEIARQQAQSAVVLNRLVERGDAEADAFNDYTKDVNRLLRRVGIGGLLVAIIAIGLTAFQIVQASGTQTVVALTPTPIPPKTTPVPTLAPSPSTPITIGTP